MNTVYNYNLNKDLRALQDKIKGLEQIKPFVNKAKNKIISNKIRELNNLIIFILINTSLMILS